ELLQPLAIKGSQPSLETVAAGCRQRSGDLPVILADEALDLAFAVADETQRHGLHTTSRTGAGELAPQNGREIEANEIIEGAASKIGVDQRHVDVARVRHCVEHGFLGDGVEDDAAHLFILEHRSEEHTSEI